MKKRIHLNHMLANAGTQIPFDDGDPIRVWKNAINAKHRQPSPLKWLIPVAAACTVLVTLAAVPQARAAVLGFFGRVFNVMDYMNADRDSRPENSAVAALVQTVEPTTLATSMPEGDWTKDVKVNIDEVLYDGQFVFVKYTVDSADLANFMGMECPMPSEGQSVSFKEFMAGELQCGGKKLQIKEGGEQPVGEGLWQDVVKYDASAIKDLTGSVDASFTVDFVNTVQTLNEGRCKMAGQTTFNFQINLDEGRKAVNQTVSGDMHPLSGEVTVTDEKQQGDISTFTNRKVSMDGCSLVVESILKKPTETRVTMRFIPSASFAELNPYGPKLFFLHIALMDGEKIVGECDGVRLEGKGVYRIDMSAPLLPTDTKRLTVKATFDCTSVMNGQDLTQGQSVRVDSGSFDDKLVRQEINGGTFEIDLNKQ